MIHEARCHQMHLTSRPIQSANQHTPDCRQSRRVTPVFPLSTPHFRPTDRTIHKRHLTPRDQDSAQRPAVPKVRGRVDGQAHEDIPHAVDDHQAVDEPPFGCRDGSRKFEELERVERTEDGVDPEADEDGGEDGGDDVEGGGVRDAGGCHVGRDVTWGRVKLVVGEH